MRAEEPADDIGRQFAAWVRGPGFTCLAARSALRRGTLTLRVYRDLASAADDERLHADLVDFVAGIPVERTALAAFCAVFRAPGRGSEEAFERDLWDRLTALRRVDAREFSWADDVSSDPDSPHFGFSVAGHPFFVAGLHPGASRISRRFAYPALVFNSHRQFRRLRQTGAYAGFQRRIRALEIALQGGINPMLSEHGTASEAGQYSGRAVGPDWRCPFRSDD
ncbi:guanitoxin biosynthesis heme-dependent pre-guanitoxin N-hydroxylase GntA [Actinosynnema sp. NPDC059797]